MGEGLGRWKVAAYGVSLGIDFANLDCQKTAKRGQSPHSPRNSHLNLAIWIYRP